MNLRAADGYAQRRQIYTNYTSGGQKTLDIMMPKSKSNLYLVIWRWCPIICHGSFISIDRKIFWSATQCKSIRRFSSLKQQFWSTYQLKLIVCTTKTPHSATVNLVHRCFHPNNNFYAAAVCRWICCRYGKAKGFNRANFFYIHQLQVVWWLKLKLAQNSFVDRRYHQRWSETFQSSAVWF